MFHCETEATADAEGCGEADAKRSRAWDAIRERAHTRRRNVCPAAEPERVISTRVYCCESQRLASVRSESAARAQAMLGRSFYEGNVQPNARGAVRMGANGIGELTSPGTMGTRMKTSTVCARV